MNWEKLSELCSVVFTAKSMRFPPSSVEIGLATLQNLSLASQLSLRYS